MSGDERAYRLTPAARALLLPLWAVHEAAMHSPSEDDLGYTCDERGCAICNLSVDEYVELRLGVLSDGYGEQPSDAELLDAARELLDDLAGATLW